MLLLGYGPQEAQKNSKVREDPAKYTHNNDNNGYNSSKKPPKKKITLRDGDVKNANLSCCFVLLTIDAFYPP